VQKINLYLPINEEVLYDVEVTPEIHILMANGLCEPALSRRDIGRLFEFKAGAPIITEPQQISPVTGKPRTESEKSVIQGKLNNIRGGDNVGVRPDGSHYLIKNIIRPKTYSACIAVGRLAGSNCGGEGQLQEVVAAGWAVEVKLSEE